MEIIESLILAIGIFMCGCAIDNGLTNIAKAIMDGKWGKMKAIQTIELNTHERIVVQDFLKLVDEISNIANKSMDDIFEYFCEVADINDDDIYSIDVLHDITKM